MGRTTPPQRSLDERAERARDSLRNSYSSTGLAAVREACKRALDALDGTDEPEPADADQITLSDHPG